MEAYFEMRDKEITEATFEKAEHPDLRRILLKCLKQNDGTHYREMGEVRLDLENLIEKMRFSVEAKDLGLTIQALMKT